MHFSRRPRWSLSYTRHTLQILVAKKTVSTVGPNWFSFALAPTAAVMKREDIATDVEVSGAYSRVRCIRRNIMKHEEPRSATANNETPRGNRWSRSADLPSTLETDGFFLTETPGQAPPAREWKFIGETSYMNIQYIFFTARETSRSEAETNRSYRIKIGEEEKKHCNYNK